MSSPRRRKPPSGGRKPTGGGRGRARSATTPKRSRTASKSPRTGRRIAAGLAVSFVMVLVLLVGVFPTRDWWDQRQQLQERQAELDRSETEAERLEERIAALQTDEEVERMAREDFGMVRPGEDAYQVLPPPVPPVELPESWPFGGAADWLNR